MTAIIQKLQQIFNRKPDLCFFVLLVLLAIGFHFISVANAKPFGIHQYRQSDCLSMAINYYENNEPFSTPAIHNLLADHGQSGHSVGEFPLTYYIAAQLWKVFGYHLWIFRGLNLLILITGVLFTFKLLRGIFRDNFIAAGVSVIIFSSPVLVYYGSNFLSNVPALSLTMIGCYWFYRYVRDSKISFWILSVVLFTLAGLLKISSLITFMVIFGLFVSQIIGFAGIRKYGLFKHRLSNLTGFLLSFLLIFAWYYYARRYNELHHAQFTFNDLWPFWKADVSTRQLIFRSLVHFQVHQLYNKITLIILMGALVAILFFLRGKNLHSRNLLVFILIITFLGTMAYMLFWFQAFEDHDYYLIDTLPFLWLVLIIAIVLIRDRMPVSPVWLRYGFVFFVLMNAGYCSYNLAVRYFLTSWRPEILMHLFEGRTWKYFEEEHRHKTIPLLQLDTMLDKAGIDKSARILSLPDESINITLVLSGRKGNTGFGFPEKEGIERIDFFKSLGAEYLIITDRDYISRHNLDAYMGNKIIEQQSVIVYKL